MQAPAPGTRLVASVSDIFDEIEVDEIRRAPPLPPPIPREQAGQPREHEGETDVGMENFLASPMYKVDATNLPTLVNNDSVAHLRVYLGDLKRPPVADRHVFIPFMLLQNLRHMGWLDSHIRNDVVGSGSARYVLTKTIVHRMSRGDRPDLCIVAYIVTHTVAVEGSARAAALVAAWKDRRNLGAESNIAISSAGGEIQRKDAVAESEISRVYAVRDRMLSILQRPAWLHNFFFDLVDVPDHEQLYSLPIL